VKRHAPAAERNRDAILEVLRRVLPEHGTVLEVASGTGQHAVHFASHLPHLVWQPSDLDPAALASGAAWPVVAADAVVCINLVHIAPWEAALGLLRGCGALLGPGAPLVLYGPFRFGGAFLAESNRSFDRALRSQDPRWGVRDARDLEEAAARHGLGLAEESALPANNHCLVFRRGAGA